MLPVSVKRALVALGGHRPAWLPGSRLPVQHAGVVLGMALALAALAPAAARATPSYAAREGRACDNCHLTPDGWVNPGSLERKCTLSCQGCHVDPAGGGMRTASGRFFGRATLPLIATSPRPTQDWDRWLFHLLYRRDRATTFNDSLPRGPADRDASRAPAHAPRDLWAHGTPFGSPSREAPYQGRYGTLRADPLLQAGWDVRVATIASGEGGVFFPMQMDLETALHPVEHVTLLAVAGARGRSAGISETFRDARTPYLRQAFVLLHEWPAHAYLKAGRITPAFGLRLDDHTAQNRRAFELDDALPEARVAGVEVGANPNYPYASLAWFRSAAADRAPAAFDPFDVDRGSGGTLNLGWRQLGWSAGGSALVRRRPVIEGGDAASFAVYGVVNPWYYRHGLPLTWQAEYDRGTWTRASGRRTRRAAFWQELGWRAGNGITLLLAQDWADPDTEVLDDHAFRVSGGVQVTPVPGVTLDARLRALMPASGSGGSDLFVQIHLWN
ncbi:MAG: hypothetical protein HZC42_07025 [Candidatus Eisenbacteria bacterium]|nr:hypothetical protein [Candidatus Eisenbacteria bacterium]